MNIKEILRSGGNFMPDSDVYKDATVLIVEDVRSYRRILTHQLNRMGITDILEANNGKKGLEILKSRKIDLVLLDIIMPEMDGRRLLSAMKSNHELHRIPVIMITVVDDISDAVKCIEKGADDYLVKPFNPVMLKARVTSCLVRKRLQDIERHYLSMYDPQTGLPNRRFFAKRIQEEINRTRQNESFFAILSIQIGNYSLIQESLGLPAWEDYLKSQIMELESVLPENRFIARVSEQEIGVLLYNIASPSVTDPLLMHIHKAMSKPMVLHHHDVLGKVKIGIVFSKNITSSPDTLMRNASLAAKRVGPKGGFRIFDEGMHRAALRRLQLGPELKRAIAENQLVLYYQPIKALYSGRIVGFEALVRWVHPEKGLLIPDVFIRLAEETGLIVPLGNWTMEEACRQAMEWLPAHSKSNELSININISGYQFSDPDFLDTLSFIMKKTGCPGKAIKLEITETVLVENPDRTEQMMNDIQSLSVGTALDDFGTGYCSLNYLYRFPFDTLKIDQSFIRGIEYNEKNRKIVENTINLAHQLGMDVVAEGIETELEKNILYEMNCDYGQGRYFSPALPAPKATDLI